MSAKRPLAGRSVKGFLLAAMIMSAAIALAPVALASGETSVTAAAEGLFPIGSQYSGVNLQGSTFGIGIDILLDGSAYGDFQNFLIGVSATGQPQNIEVEGKATNGLLNADGSATFSGTCTVDLGNGTAPSVGVPFSVTITTTGLSLVLGGTTLPNQSLSAGTINIITR